MDAGDNMVDNERYKDGVEKEAMHLFNWKYNTLKSWHLVKYMQLYSMVLSECHSSSEENRGADAKAEYNDGDDEGEDEKDNSKDEDDELENLYQEEQYIDVSEATKDYFGLEHHQYIYLAKV